MWVDIDDLRSDIGDLKSDIEREKKELAEGEKNLTILGEIDGYNKVLKMLDDIEEVYMREGRENYKRRMEEQRDIR